MRLVSLLFGIVIVSTEANRYEKLGVLALDGSVAPPPDSIPPGAPAVDHNTLPGGDKVDKTVRKPAASYYTTLCPTLPRELRRILESLGVVEKGGESGRDTNATTVFTHCGQGQGDTLAMHRSLSVGSNGALVSNSAAIVSGPLHTQTKVQYCSRAEAFVDLCAVPSRRCTYEHVRRRRPVGVLGS